MAITNHFYNQTTKKYIAVFGTLFNKMSITRDDNNGIEVQKMIVPISYGPYQKFLVRIKQDPNLNKKSAITLPRMAFEITSMQYDGTRKLGSKQKVKKLATDGGFSYSPAPYNIEFSLYIMTKYGEDGTKILEQIVPFFKPEKTTTVKLIDGMEPIDIPLVLNGVSSEDLYEADFETRRSLLWTLNFTMKAYFFGPATQKSVIKFIDVSMHDTLDTNSDPVTGIEIQPGLTAQGLPTTILGESIPYTEIDFGDDWGTIITYTDEE